MIYVAFILARLSIKLIKRTPESGAGALYVSLLTFTDQIFAKSRSTFRESGWSGGQVFMYRWLEESWIDMSGGVVCAQILLQLLLVAHHAFMQTWWAANNRRTIKTCSTYKDFVFMHIIVYSTNYFNDKKLDQKVHLWEKHTAL